MHANQSSVHRSHHRHCGCCSHDEDDVSVQHNAVATDKSMRLTRKLHIAMAITVLGMITPTIKAFTIDQSRRLNKYTSQGGGDSSQVFSMKTSGVRQSLASRLLLAAVNDDFEEDEEMPPAMEGFDLEDDPDALTGDDLQSMTVAQLKQQLRLRGKKVAGNKAQLVERLLEKSTVIGMNEVDLQPGYSKYEKPITSRATAVNDANRKSEEEARDDTKRVTEAKARGADIVDVTEFVEVEEVGKAFRSSDRKEANGYDAIDAEIEGDDEGDSEESSEASSSSPEVWGEDAKIVDDYEGRSVVVDGLSRTVIEYKGSNSTAVQAYAVGSRNSLTNFLKGGQQTTRRSEDDDDDSNKKKSMYSSMEEEVYAIQKKREMESKRGLIRPDEVEGMEDRSDMGAVYDTIERDDGDWGVYTPTGAQLSSSEVQGVLLLSDVYGSFTDNMQALADKIAFECQPVVVLVPDLFRGKPWTQSPVLDEAGVERNEVGQSYEEWRAQHPDRRVDVDIRAAAAVLRERYAVSSIAVWGTCYGGGRALEAAAGWYPGGAESYYDDVLGDRPAPPHVDPIAAIAWYPTRYDAKKLFGKANEGFRTFESGKDREVAVMAVFAENDSLAGATPEDAMLLKECLEEDSRIKDCMVKIFPDQKHGFAHSSLGVDRSKDASDSNDDGEQDGMDRYLEEDYGSGEPMAMGGDAEVACLLSTAWMETYTRIFLPTVGSPVMYDADERWNTLDMDGYSQNERKEVRDDLEEAISKFDDVDPDLRRMSQSSSPLLDGPGSEAFEKIEEERERIRQEILEKYDLTDEDDEEAFDRKLMQARDDGALNGLLLDAYMDDSGDAYW